MALAVAGRRLGVDRINAGARCEQLLDDRAVAGFHRQR